jgi:hypothetical protein
MQKVVYYNQKEGKQQQKEETKMMKSMYYRFADGYECWTTGKLTGTERKWAIVKHGKILVEKIA